MSMRTGFLMFMAATCIWPAQKQDQTKEATRKTSAREPSAKEMFLHPRQMPYIPQDEAPPIGKVKVKPPKPKPDKPKTADLTATENVQSAKPAEVAATESVPPAQPAGERPVQLIQTSNSGVPLGLRYTLQKKVSGQTVDVADDTEFHSGDHIRLSVEVNDTGYLYIINQEPGGRWKAMFPSPEIDKGDNRVQRGQAYTVPPGYMFTFSGATGVEHLFVIFSRQRVNEIDTLIYSLKGARQPPAAEQREVRPTPEALMADASFDNSQIVKMRAAIVPRDLIIEKDGEEPVGQQQSSQRQDKSVYVVNRKGSADSRVVAEIALVHK